MMPKIFPYPSVPAFIFFTLSITSSHTTVAQVNATPETHSTEDIDPNAPIVALDKLDSLKHVPPLSMTLPTITHFVTPAGTPVRFVQTKNLPIVDVDIRFNAGGARDEAIKTGGYGIASLTAEMLTQGSRDWDENQIAESAEQLGINLSANAYKDMFVVQLRSLADEAYLTPAIALTQSVLTTPTFPSANLERTKAQYLLALQRKQEDPDSIAADTFNQALYGNHPYAHPTQGTLQSIPTISRDDLQAFAQRFLVARNASIAITGDIDLERAKSLASALTANLPKGTPAPPLPDVVVTPLSAKTADNYQHIHVPFDSTQTTVIIGQLGDKRSNDSQVLQQQMNFAIADDIVGGGNFQARLMNDIRKKRGLTYGIYSNMTPMLSQGSYTIRYATRNDKAQESIDATLAVIDDTLKHGVYRHELELTKEGLKNGFPLGFASNDSINNTLGMMNFYQLPDSYLTEYVERIDNATLADVNQAYRQQVNPNQFIIVTVGKAAEPSNPDAHQAK